MSSNASTATRAVDCLTFEERPSTPHSIRKFRKSYFSEPGMRVTHFGAIDDEAKQREQDEREHDDHRINGGHALLKQEQQRRVRDRLQIEQSTPSLKATSAHAATTTATATAAPPRQHCSTLAGVFHQTESGSFAEYLRERNESIYKSHQREPLGKPYVRGIAPTKKPGNQGDQSLGFSELDEAKARARAFANEESQAKQLIYLREAPDAEREEHARTLYRKSHGSYLPGEQKTRNYEWKEGIDPEHFRFGTSGGGGGGGGPGKLAVDAQATVATCLRPDVGAPGNLSTTIITNSKVAAFKQVTAKPLGHSRSRDSAQARANQQGLGLASLRINEIENNEELISPALDSPSVLRAVAAVEGGEDGSSPRPETTTTGTTSTTTTKPEWSAAECITGSYTMDEQLPDGDLGKATRPGWRNRPLREQDGSRAFGCPTVRTDIAPPARRSVSDGQNYGDDTHAKMLLYPSRFSSIGVGDEDFLRPRAKEDLVALFDHAGYGLDTDQVDRLYTRACDEVTYTPAGQASVHDYRVALNQWLDAQDAGTLPAWW